jgi:hypothetical protein
MKGFTEELPSFTVFRSRRTFPFRNCPRHGGELELCVNDTDYSKWPAGHQPLYNHHDNRIAWRCESCLGFWFENHFINATLDSVWSDKASDEARLRFSCPACGSFRMHHLCIPECCGHHRCFACGTEFDAETLLIHRGTRPESKVLSVALDATTSERTFEPEKDLRTGVTRSYRSCPEHPSRKLELVFMKDSYVDAYHAAWLCDACSRAQYEYGAFRRQHWYFRHEVKPGAKCPVCSWGFDLENQPEAERPNRCRCNGCGSIIDVDFRRR